MNYALVEISCPNCNEKFQAGKGGEVIEGQQYYATCPHCGIRTQFMWGVFYGCLSYRSPRGVALLEAVETKQK